MNVTWSTLRSPTADVGLVVHVSHQARGWSGVIEALPSLD
jgi:hypothetical protein